MEPSEALVIAWLKDEGYFVMHSVKAKHNKEIDILAIHPLTDKRIHIEVKVAINPTGGLRAWGAAKHAKEDLPVRVKLFCQNKFVGKVNKDTRLLEDACIQDVVTENLGTSDYEKWLVFGAIDKGDTEEKLRKELKKNGVKLVLLKDVLRKMEARMTENVYMDDARRYLQIFWKFVTRECEEGIKLPAG